MAISIAQSNSGTTGSSAPSSVNVTLPGSSAAGNTLVLAVSADAYFASPPTGWTLNANSKNETFLGQYIFTKVAAGGESSWSISTGSSVPMAWVVMEVAGAAASAFDIAAAQFVQSSGNSYTTPNLTPSAGQRLLVAAIGGSLSSTTLQSVAGWTNSFTELADQWTSMASGTNDSLGVATRIVTADGSTAYSTGATWDGGVSPQARAAIILSLKANAAGNTDPVSNAGADQTVGTNTLVTLDGSGSSDTDGTIEDYTWRQISGTSVSLSSTSVANPTFTSPNTNGALVFGLTVTDDQGGTSTEDTVTITVSSAVIQTAVKIRVSGSWQDKPLNIRSGGTWIS